MAWVNEVRLTEGLVGVKGVFPGLNLECASRSCLVARLVVSWERPGFGS